MFRFDSHPVLDSTPDNPADTIAAVAFVARHYAPGMPWHDMAALVAAALGTSYATTDAAYKAWGRAHVYAQERARMPLAL